MISLLFISNIINDSKLSTAENNCKNYNLFPTSKIVPSCFILCNFYVKFNFS